MPQLEQLLFSKPVAFLYFSVSWVFVDAAGKTDKGGELLPKLENWSRERERQPAAIFKTSRLGFEN